MKTKVLLLAFILCSGLIYGEDEIYSINFTQETEGWTINNVQLDGLSSVWQQTSQYGMKASAYVSNSNHTTESWLISPEIDLSPFASATLTINQALNKGTKEGLYVKISDNKGQSWSNLTLSMPAGTSWTFQNNSVEISAWIGKKVQLAFVYTSSTTNCPTWEIKTVKVTGEESVIPDPCLYEYLSGLKGTQIRDSLYNHISVHTVLTYDACRADNAKVDIRDDGSVWDMYASCTWTKRDYCGIEEYEACECFNREHLLPKSFWGGSTDEPMYTDLHHVIPADYEANTMRSAWVYDEVKNVTWTNNVSKLGTSTHFGNNVTAFEPADEFKGDIARVYFYMITCYKKKNFTKGGQGYRYFLEGTASLKSTALNLLLQWHREDPVSDKERVRNEKVKNKQGNANPFVEVPELVEYIWGDKKQTVYRCPEENTGISTPSEFTHPSRGQKVIRDGRIYLQVEDRCYDMMGNPVLD